ncbi:MAG: caspase family protein [Sandaracinaceae bacterium]
MVRRATEGAIWGAALIAVALGGCGGGDDKPPGEPTPSGAAAEGPGGSAGEGGETPTPDPVLLREEGQLGDDDPEGPQGRYDRFFVEIAAGDRVVVELRSEAFDPTLEVTPPSMGALVNDDWEGDTSRSRLELVSAAAGSMRIEVRSYGDGAGAYRLTVERVPSAGGDWVPLLGLEQATTGELAEGDRELADGTRYDPYLVQTERPARIRIQATDGDPPRSTVVGPDGLSLRESEPGVYETVSAGRYSLQVVGPGPGQGARYRVTVEPREGGEASQALARAHHRFDALTSQLSGSTLARPTGTTPGADPDDRVAILPVRVGDRLSGNLAENDHRLPSGELVDVYALEAPGPLGEVIVELESPDFDTYLRVDGPTGEHWENDDYGGALDSRLVVPIAAAGTYRISATSYRGGATGRYELKVLGQRSAPDPASSAPGGPPSGPPRVETGALSAGDEQLSSGEYVDEHRFTWPMGARVHLEARSPAFDAYLIVRSPSGAQQENDDLVPGQTTNAGLDVQVTEAGPYRVLVTSYEPGETGAYELLVRGAGASSSGGETPARTGAEGGGGAPSATAPSATAPSATAPSATAPSATAPSATPPGPSGGARTESGSLATGDRTLSSGELYDAYTMTFAPRRSVALRLESTDFDPYLIVRSPSGQQEDNDDLAPGSLNSGIDIPVAEPGPYQVVVTSYRPGETGAYRLRATEGASPGGGDPTPGASPGGAGRVWGLFAGISDYPGNVNDLPECANDARKLAQAVREQGVMPPEQEFLLTDGEVTQAALRRAMRTIASRIRPDDVFLFFYSGHGGQTDSSADSIELDERDEYLVLYDGNLLDDELGSLFDQVRARVAMAAIDACFAGGFAKDLIDARGRVGLFSSEEDVTSAVADRFQAGGYLSHFLRLGIGGEADRDPHNAVLTVGELTHYTWQQFGRHASDVRMSMGYQHLVMDRGAVHTDEVLWARAR